MKRYPYLGFIAPGFVLYTLFVVYPIFSAMAISLTKWNGIGPKAFIGFANYVQLFTDTELFSQFINALKNNGLFFALNLFINTPIQLYLAYLIYTKMKGYRFFQAMIFAPQFITSSVIVFMAVLILDNNIGVFNHLLDSIGLDAWSRNWLGIPGYGMLVVFFINGWAGIGFGMVYFIGAMKMIPGDMLEAAYMDGAGYWGRFFQVILPNMRSSIINIVILTYIFSMTAFDYNFLLGGTSGGINHNMDVLALFFYRITFGTNTAMGATVDTNSMGMGSTVACVMFALILAISYIQIATTARAREGRN